MAGISRPHARVYDATSSAVTTSAGTVAVAAKKSMASVSQDNDGMASSGSLTIRTAGVWLLVGAAQWLSNTAAGWRTNVLVDATAGRILALDRKIAFATASDSTYMSLVTVEYLAIGAVIEMRVSQSSGANAFMDPNLWGCTLSACILSG
jgi:hypothetical protein